MNENNYEELHKQVLHKQDPKTGLDIYAIKWENSSKLVYYWKNINSSNINNVIVILNNSDNIRIKNNQICISLDGINNINDIKVILSVFSREIQKMGIDVTRVRFIFIIDNDKQREDISVVVRDLGISAFFEVSNNVKKGNVQEVAKKRIENLESEKLRDGKGKIDSITVGDKKYSVDSENKTIHADSGNNGLLSDLEKKKMLLEELMKDPKNRQMLSEMTAEELDKYLMDTINRGKRTSYMERATTVSSNDSPKEKVAMDVSHKKDGVVNRELGIGIAAPGNPDKYFALENGNNNNEYRVVSPSVSTSQMNSGNVSGNSTAGSVEENISNNDLEEGNDFNLTKLDVASKSELDVYYVDSSGIIYNKDGNAIGQVGVNGYLIDPNNNLIKNNKVLGEIGDINDMGKSSTKSIGNDNVIDFEKAKSKRRVYKPERPRSGIVNTNNEKSAAFISLPIILFIISLVLLVVSGIILFMIR